MKQEEIERQAQKQKDKKAAEEDRRMESVEATKNKELLDVFKQFDRYKISNGAESLEVSQMPINNGLHFVCVKLGSCSSSIMRSWSELGAVLLAARYFAKDERYLLLCYDRRDQHSSHEVGRYKDVGDLMSAVVAEVSKL